MTNTVTIGRRLVPLASIALVEPFDASAHPGMKTDKVFKARIVLLDRQSVLSEDTPEAFIAAHGFRIVGGEGVGLNPSVRFSVESFVPAEGFVPNKPYASRLLWRDLEGNSQSKLFVIEPRTLLAIAVTGEKVEEKPPAPKGGGSRKPTATIDRRKARRRAPQPEPV